MYKYGLKAAPSAVQTGVVRGTAKWLTLPAVVAPIVLTVAYTVGGLLRPDYSPVQQAISDLGVGPNAWLLNVPVVVAGLAFAGFAAGLFTILRTELPAAWRWVLATLAALTGMGYAAAGIFTEDPTTVLLHWLLGANLAFFTPVLLFLAMGLLLRQHTYWRAWSAYSLVSGIVTVLLIATMFAAFTPGSALADAHVAGLLERAVMIESDLWFIITGCVVFRLVVRVDA
jgi:hypothetical membrane protein